ncbi:hypothetical protein [Lysinibacillus fusiformis]|uniref:hypothetical protein n=1 Tax=Lysinibacillus fusiformis TaxID=28031 RepID=UPI003D06CC2F
MPDIGDSQTATLTVDPSGPSTDGALTVTAPDGTTATPTVSGAGTSTLTATVTYAQAGWHLLRWDVTGTGAGVEFQHAFVGADPATPPAAFVYATVEQLREEFTDDNANLPEKLLQKALKATSRGIDRFCGRRFWQDPGVVTRVYRPEHDDVVWVDDISTTSGLIVATDTTGDGSYATTWAASDYELQPLNADKDGPGYAWWRLHAVNRYAFPLTGKVPPLRVTARFGWSSIPDDVTEACILRAAAIFKRRESITGVAGFGDFGVVRISRRRDPDVAELLDNFIKIKVGSV